MISDYARNTSKTLSGNLSKSLLLSKNRNAFLRIATLMTDNCEIFVCIKLIWDDIKKVNNYTFVSLRIIIFFYIEK